MELDIITNENRGISRYFSWKMVLGFMLLPPLLQIILLIIVFSHFTTFNGAPISELFANVLLYVGNWPSFLFKMYPYVLSNDGEVVYEAFPSLAAFIIDLIGWGLLGLVSGYIIRKAKRRAKYI